MKILIIGAGAREYSMGLSFLKDERISNIYFYTGNGATSKIGCNLDSNTNVISFCVSNKIDLVVFGAEALLVSGLGDILSSNGIRVFGPSKKASMLEGSKIFMKNILQKYNIPTSRFISGSDFNSLCEFIDDLNSSDIVLKADGLCGGKGVIIAKSKAEAKNILKNMLSGELFGDSGKSVVVEEFLNGFELSIFAISDGENFILLPSSQDHKRLLDNDLGPNTGGMGAYSPTPFLDEMLLSKIENKIIIPTLKAMKNENSIFKGVLFCGIMVVDNEPYVLEFNVRFGDPECEVILPLLKTPLLDIINATLDSNLKDFKCEFLDKYCVGVVVAGGNYPNPQSSVEEIEFHDINYLSNESSHISFGNVSFENNKFYANGGRVFVCVGLGDSLSDARGNSYNLIEKIKFKNMQYRKDIANRAK